MRHDIVAEAFGPRGEAMAHAVEACVHCGLCLPSCPTYQVLNQEMDSPRGRIILMKEVLEGGLTADEAAPFLERCLGCLGCETACPSGVPYGELIGTYRAYAARTGQNGATERAVEFLLTASLPYPNRFRLASRAGKLARRLPLPLPGTMAAMLELVPDELPASEPFPEVYPAAGTRRARVALLTGCVQQVLAPEINWATLRVLARNGVETIIPRDQGCCGALGLHMGNTKEARRLAQNNLDCFPSELDAIVTNAAGCGSGMKEYPLLFKGHAQSGRAERFADQVMDITVFLHALGMEPPPPLAQPLLLAYHDACHLAHAQGVRAQPRSLLGLIGNLDLVEIPDGDICCGSAGTYNLQQPDIARQLGEQKARNILSTGARAIATGNIGCLTQISAHLKALGRPLPIFHTIQVLDLAYRGGSV
ncbi:MAG: heterodisulfide reductase-related iron-sulfur binding cluster [Chloroflexota bacterium]|nr:heterodisulfide reductase-related iron-sulfur binding cluster [Chloroflexota bacterium]